MARNLEHGAKCSRQGPALIYHGRSKACRTVVILAVSLALSGCFSTRKQSLYTASVNNPVHAERHPISVRTGAVELKIEVLRHMAALGSSQRMKVSSFARKYKSIGAGPLSILVPRGAINEMAASNVVDDVSQMMIALGIPAAAINITDYQADPGMRNPPLVLKYQRYYASPSACGNWPGNIAADFENKPYPNFACANQNNLAAMVANPRDLIAPRTMTPVDIRRRMVVYDKYIKGEVTSAKRSSDEKSTVSNVGSN